MQPEPFPFEKNLPGVLEYLGGGNADRSETGGQSPFDQGLTQASAFRYRVSEVNCC